MPQIICSATSCAYNRDNACGLPEIHVAGRDASRACSTCCSDFRTDGRYSSPRPADFARVECAAEFCRHNADGNCDAGSIDIGGRRATCSTDTECDTFTRR